jgi:hypothetical protein
MKAFVQARPPREHDPARKQSLCSANNRVVCVLRPIYWRTITRWHSSLQTSTHDATRPTPISRARAHPPPIEVGIRILRRARFLVADPVRQDPTCCVVYPGCTSRQLNTHSTEEREVLYPWHPWHSRSAYIVEAVNTESRAVFHCVTEQAVPGLARRSLQIPQWMFDAAVCHRVRMETTPSVNARALQELRHLLSASRAPAPEVMLEAQHRSWSHEGGADASRCEVTPAEPTQAVPSDHHGSDLGAPAARDARANGTLARTPATRALGEREARQASKRGAR